MPPSKPVRTLTQLSMDSLTHIIAKSCRIIHHLEHSMRNPEEAQKRKRLRSTPEINICDNLKSGEDAVQQLKTMLSDLPSRLLETLLMSVTNSLIGRNKETSNFWVALRSFPLEYITKINFSRLFHGFRLSRVQNNELKVKCVEIINQTPRLTELVLIGKCTDTILKNLTENCPMIRYLNISLSDSVTSDGLSHLKLCKELSHLDLTKCWVRPEDVVRLLKDLPLLRRLEYQNMRRVLGILLGRMPLKHGQAENSVGDEKATDDSAPSDESAKPPRSDTIETSSSDKNDDTSVPSGNKVQQFNLDTFDSTEHSGEFDDGVDDENFWSKGYVKFCDVNLVFPHVTTVKLLLADSEIRHLEQIKGLTHVEIEMTDDPDAGCIDYFQHPEGPQAIRHLIFQFSVMSAQLLRLIATNCQQIKALKLIGNDIENAASLLASDVKRFNKLEILELRLYRFDDENSGDEEMELPHHSPDILQYFLGQPGHADQLALRQVNIHIGCSQYFNLQFLQSLVSVSWLPQLKHFSLAESASTDIQLTKDAVYWILSEFPELQYLSVTNWNLTKAELQHLTTEAKECNYNIEYV